MATEADIAAVRANVNEPTEATYSDVQIGELIDSGSVESASAQVWRFKAAAYSELVDVTEAGASHKLSDLHKTALTMATLWESRIVAVVATGRPRVKKIVRS